MTNIFLKTGSGGDNGREKDCVEKGHDYGGWKADRPSGNQNIDSLYQTDRYITSHSGFVRDGLCDGAVKMISSEGDSITVEFNDGNAVPIREDVADGENMMLVSENPDFYLPMDYGKSGIPGFTGKKNQVRTGVLNH